MKTGLEEIAQARTAAEINLAAVDIVACDELEGGELAGVAACYALMGAGYLGTVHHWVAGLWPFGVEQWEPAGSKIANLAKAGALIAMEIDRLREADKRIIEHEK